MRVYQTLTEAHSEIQRDLFKSPTVHSSSVQGRAVHAQARECLGYTYSVIQMPDDPLTIAEMAVGLGFVQSSELEAYADWLQAELRARCYWEAGQLTERAHPLLSNEIEGREPSYTYSDRLAGMVRTMAETLSAQPDTRRAFWPMFRVEDSYRASRRTRIPCTIGYEFIIRPVNNLGGPMAHYLHGICVQRSCDFGHFWLSDLWFTHKLKQAVYNQFQYADVDRAGRLHLHEGHTTHMILSFHAFVEGEIY